MTLKTTIKALNGYEGKSKFPFWDAIEPNDLIEISYKITRNWGNYAPEIQLKLLKNNMTFVSGSGQFNNYMKNLKYEEIEQKGNVTTPSY